MIYVDIKSTEYDTVNTSHCVYWYKRLWRADKLRKISIASKRGISRRFAVPSDTVNDWLHWRFHVSWRADNFGE